MMNESKSGSFYERRLYLSIIACGLICASGYIVLGALNERYFDWNAIRLAPAAALLNGLTIYPPADSGVVTGHIYTPLGALAYAPVVWLRDIHIMMTAGSLLAQTYFALPFVWLASLAVSRGHVSALDATGVTVAVLLVTALDPALSVAAIIVHVEAPAVGFACLAMIAAAHAGENNPRYWAWSGALAVGAVLSKQTLLPTWLVLGMTITGLAGRTAAMRYLAGSVAAAGLFATFLTLFGNWHAFIYNCIWVPGHHAWRTLGYEFAFGAPANAQAFSDRAVAVGRAFFRYEPYWWPAYALAIWCLLRCLQSRPAQEEPLARVALFAAIAACVQFPLSLASFVKVGGDVNAFAPALTPLLLMLTALAIGTFAPVRKEAPPRRMLIAVLIVLVISIINRLCFLIPTGAMREDPNPPMIAYLRNHPGEIYLPWNPMHTWIAEARRDHFEYGVFDRALAGVPMSAAHFRANLPPHIRWVAVPRNHPPSGRDMYRRYIPGLREIPSPPGLDYWRFFEVTY